MNHFRTKCILGLVFILFFGSNCTVFASEDSITHQVYVLVNSLSKESKEIADFYTTQRGIPKSNILALEMSLKEEISIEDYVRTIHNPLLKMLLERKLVQGVVDSRVDQWGRKKMSVASHDIAFLVTTHGVPLKFTDFSDEKTIEERRTDAQSMEKLQASVDSELSSILLNYYSSFSGPIDNKLSGNKDEAAWKQSRIIRTSRLDGPSVKTIKKRIEDAIYAEAYGLHGRAYFDLGGPYKLGDEWISKASELVKDAYYEIDLENTKKLMGFANRLDAPAIYMGWYRQTAYGQWRDFSIKVPRGAIAYHLHSYSATTIRTQKKAWVGPLLEKGYATTFGYVYEPFLGLTVRPDLFIESLLAGNSLGEAYFLANPAISWQSILIGDPLYRPFLKSLSDQLETTQGGIFKNYIYLNEYYKNKELLGEHEAVTIAKRRLFENPNLALMFTVGRDMIEKEAFDSAIHIMKPMTLVSDFHLEDLALVDAVAQLFLKAGKKQLALKLYQNMLFKNKLPKTLELKLLENGLSVAYLNGDYQFSSKVNKRILELEADQ